MTTPPQTTTTRPQTLAQTSGLKAKTHVKAGTIYGIPGLIPLIMGGGGCGGPTEPTP